MMKIWERHDFNGEKITNFDRYDCIFGIFTWLWNFFAACFSHFFWTEYSLGEICWFMITWSGLHKFYLFFKKYQECVILFLHLHIRVHICIWVPCEIILQNLLLLLVLWMRPALQSRFNLNFFAYYFWITIVYIKLYSSRLSAWFLRTLRSTYLKIDIFSAQIPSLYKFFKLLISIGTFNNFTIPLGVVVIEISLYRTAIETYNYFSSNFLSLCYFFFCWNYGSRWTVPI